MRCLDYECKSKTLDLNKTEDLNEYFSQTGGHVQPVVASKLKTNLVKLRKLGEGSYGKVVLVENIRTHRLYAMKVFKKERLRRKRSGMSTNAWDSCLMEVEIHKKLSHPNIVKLYEVINDTHSERLHMMLEYMARGPVQYTDHFSSIPVPRCQEIMFDALQGLSYLHQHGIVHGDIKPDNIVLNQTNVAKIGDFSVSQIVENSTGMVTRSPGTPGYTAPECLSCDSYNGYAADMWAFGITLYSMLTGEHPFPATQISELYKQIVETPVKLPQEEFEDQPMLVEFVDGLLCLDPTKRLTADKALQHPWMVEIALIPSKIDPKIRRHSVHICRHTANPDVYRQRRLTPEPLNSRNCV